MDAHAPSAERPRRSSIGSRLELAVDWALESKRAERASRWVLGVAVLVYAAVALWLTRGASFVGDELSLFGESDGFAPSSLAEPFGGHLMAVTRGFYEASLRLFGPDHLPIQLLTIAFAAMSAVLLYALIRRRIGPVAALAPAVVVLFLGSTPEVLQGSATMWTQATAAGLAAFLGLDRRSRGGDVFACVMLIVAVLSFEVGIAFAIGAGVWILAEPDRRSRIWVVLLPLAIYGTWWLWALQFDEGLATFSNVFLIPSWAADSFASAVAAMTGLGIDLTDGPMISPIAPGWGRVVGVIGIGLIVVGVRRSGTSPLFWGSIALLLILWIAGALSFGPLRVPTAARYAYPVAIGLVLILAASFPSPLSRRALLTVFALAALALSVNLWLLKSRGDSIRASSDTAQARLAIIELEREIVPPGYTEDRAVTLVPATASTYLEAADRFGSLGYSLEKLSARPEPVREQADSTLGRIASPRTTRLDDGPLKCARREGVEVTIPPGGAVLRSTTGGTLSLRRFADEPVIEAGRLAPGIPGQLELPLDGASQPWRASIGARGTLALCSSVDSAEGS